jgi:hypothetical protein
MAGRVAVLSAIFHKIKHFCGNLRSYIVFMADSMDFGTQTKG